MGELLDQVPSPGQKSQQNPTACCVLLDPFLHLSGAADLVENIFILERKIIRHFFEN